MPRRCSVPGCRTNYTHPYLPTFCFPKEDDLRKKWEMSIRRKNFVPSKYSSVCIKHFPEEMLVRDDVFVNSKGMLVSYRRKIIKLISGAYPIVDNTIIVQKKKGKITDVPFNPTNKNLTENEMTFVRKNEGKENEKDSNKNLLEPSSQKISNRSGISNRNIIVSCADDSFSEIEVHPTDEELKEKISQLLSVTNLEIIVIKKIFQRYPQIKLHLRKEFICSTVRQILLHMAEPELFRSPI